MRNTVFTSVGNDPMFASTARWIVPHLGGLNVRAARRSQVTIATARRLRPAVLARDVAMPGETPFVAKPVDAKVLLSAVRGLPAVSAFTR